MVVPQFWVGVSHPPIPLAMPIFVDLYTRMGLGWSMSNILYEAPKRSSWKWVWSSKLLDIPNEGAQSLGVTRTVKFDTFKFIVWPLSFVSLACRISFAFQNILYLHNNYHNYERVQQARKHKHPFCARIVISLSLSRSQNNIFDYLYLPNMTLFWHLSLTSETFRVLPVGGAIDQYKNYIFSVERRFVTKYIRWISYRTSSYCKIWG